MILFVSVVTAVQSLNSLNDQIAQFMVPSPCSLPEEDEHYVPGQRDNLKQSMTLMRHLLMDAQVSGRDKHNLSLMVERVILLPSVNRGS